MNFSLMKEAGLSEEDLMEMPVYRKQAYYHAALRSHDIWTVPITAGVKDQMDSLADISITLPYDEDDEL